MNDWQVLPLNQPKDLQILLASPTIQCEMKNYNDSISAMRLAKLGVIGDLLKELFTATQGSLINRIILDLSLQYQKFADSVLPLQEYIVEQTLFALRCHQAAHRSLKIKDRAGVGSQLTTSSKIAHRLAQEVKLVSDHVNKLHATTKIAVVEVPRITSKLESEIQGLAKTTAEDKIKAAEHSQLVKNCIAEAIKKKEELAAELKISPNDLIAYTVKNPIPANTKKKAGLAHFYTIMQRVGCLRGGFYRKNLLHSTNNGRFTDRGFFVLHIENHCSTTTVPAPSSIMAKKIIVMKEKLVSSFLGDHHGQIYPNEENLWIAFLHYHELFALDGRKTTSQIVETAKVEWEKLRSTWNAINALRNELWNKELVQCYLCIDKSMRIRREFLRQAQEQNGEPSYLSFTRHAMNYYEESKHNNTIEIFDQVLKKLGEVCTLIENTRVFWERLKSKCVQLKDTSLSISQDEPSVNTYDELHASAMSWMWLGSNSLQLRPLFRENRKGICRFLNSLPISKDSCDSMSAALRYVHSSDPIQPKVSCTQPPLTEYMTLNEVGLLFYSCIEKYEFYLTTHDENWCGYCLLEVFQHCTSSRVRTALSNDEGKVDPRTLFKSFSDFLSNFSNKISTSLNKVNQECIALHTAKEDMNKLIGEATIHLAKLEKIFVFLEVDFIISKNKKNKIPGLDIDALYDHSGCESCTIPGEFIVSKWTSYISESFKLPELPCWSKDTYKELLQKGRALNHEVQATCKKILELTAKKEEILMKIEEKESIRQKLGKEHIRCCAIVHSLQRLQKHFKSQISASGIERTLAGKELSCTYSTPIRLWIQENRVPDYAKLTHVKLE